MTDDQHREISRGDHAARLLGDPLLQEVLEQIKSGVRDALFDLPYEAVEARERLFMLDKMRAQFVNLLAAMADGAEILRAELLMEENAKAKAAAVMERVRHG